MSDSEAPPAPVETEKGQDDAGSERQRTSDSWVMVEPQSGEKPQEKPEEDQPAEEKTDKPAEPEEEPKPEEPSTEQPPEETPAEEKPAEETPAEEKPAEETPAAEPEDKPTEPEEAPAEPEEKSAEPEEKPAEPEEKPTEPEEKPAEPEEKPAEPEEKPTEPEDKPTEPEEKPAEPEEKPTEPEEKPAEPEEKPAESEEKPTETEDKPAEPEEKPTEPEVKPTEAPAEDKPAEENPAGEGDATVEVTVVIGESDKAKEEERQKSPEPGENTQFGEYLRLLQVGSDLKKVKKNKALLRIFRLEEDLLGISWNSQHKKASRARIPIADIKEIRSGRNTDTFKTSTIQIKDELCFSIVYTYSGSFRTLDLATLTEAEQVVWVKGLSTLISEEGAGIEHSTRVRNRWLQDLFNEADVNGDGTLDLKEVINMMRKLNVGISKKVLRQKFKEADSDGNFDGKLNFSEFCTLFSELASRPELKRLFNLYSSKVEWLTVHDLQKFLQLEQGAASPSLELCNQLIEKYELTTAGKSQGMMSLDGFTQFMLSPESDIFNVDHSQVYQDMTQPLSHYYIASSHNTYLLEDQLKGPSSCEAYIRALRKGCRCVELDCWDGPDDDPIIYHGHTLTSKIAFKDAIQAIKDYAFETSSYPVILSIENHCSISQQHSMAEYMEDIFGDMLFKHGRDEDREHLPSPKELKFKILIKGKKLPKDLEELDNDEGEVSDEDEAADIDHNELSKVAPPQQEEAKSEEPKAKEDEATGGEAAKKEEDKPAASEETEKKEEEKPAASEAVTKKEEDKPVEGEKKEGEETTAAATAGGEEGKKDGEETKKDEEKKAETPKRKRTLSFKRKRPVQQAHPKKKIKLSSKLSKCINYVQSVHFKGMDVLDGKMYHMSSFGESSAFKYTGQLPVRFTQYNRRQLSRIYPGGSRVTSTNYDPVPMWNAGCQIVALNYQTPCKPMDFNDGKFLQNGGCGYVLKPEIMREELSRFDHTQRMHHIGGVTPKALTIKVISGQHLPKPGERKKGEVIDPYVVIQLAGVGDDCKRVMTKAVNDNGFNPLWDETFEFVVRFPELALIRFKVMDKDWGPNKDDFIASFALPFDSVVPGYRHIHLTKAGQKIENATLFVHIHVQEYIAPLRLHAHSKFKSNLSLKKSREYPEHHLVGHQPIDLHFRNCPTPLHRGVDLKEDFAYAQLHFKETCGHGPQAELSECVQLVAAKAKGFKLELNTIGKEKHSQVYKLVVVTEEGQTVIIPSALQAILDAFNQLNQTIQPVLELSDAVVKDLETIYKEAKELKGGLVEHLNQSAANPKRFDQVMDHYCRTMFTLKSESDQLRKVKENAVDVLKELNMACQKAGIEVNSSI